MGNNNHFYNHTFAQFLGVARTIMVVGFALSLVGCSPLVVKYQYTDGVLTSIEADRGLKSEDSIGNKIDTMSPSPLDGLLKIENAKVVQ